MKRYSMLLKSLALAAVVVLVGGAALAQGRNGASLAGGTPGKNNGTSTTPRTAGKQSLTATCSSASVVWDNGPFNGVDGLVSMQDPTYDSRTADDFVVTQTPGLTVTEITADMYTNQDISNPSTTSVVEIYATAPDGNGPVRNGAAPLFRIPASAATLVGSGFGLNIVRFTYATTGVTLLPGRYWVAPVIIYDGSRFSYFCSSNGASPDPGQISYFRGGLFSVPDWTDCNTSGYTNQLQHAFTVSGCVATPQAVNEQVSFTTTTQSLTGIAGSCATLGYTNQYNLNVDLRNIGLNTLASPYFQVAELRETSGMKPVNPFRLKTADDFAVETCTGGLVGTTQAIPGPITPNQVVPVNFQIAMPSLVRFRFIVEVYAVAGPSAPVARASRRLGNLAVEAKEFDRAGNPILTATFIPEKGMEGQFQVAGVKATVTR